MMGYSTNSLTMSPFQLNNWLFIFTIGFHYTNSVLMLNEHDKKSEHQIEFALKLFSEISNNFKCVHFITQNASVQNTASNIYKLYDIPVIISHIAIKSDCQDYVMIVSNSTQALILVRKLHLGTRNKIILFSLDEECPGTERLLIGAKVILACSLTKSIYNIGISGEFLVFPESARLFQDQSSLLPDYKGRLLHVSTFDCPPFSYSTNGALDGIEMKIFLEISQRLNFTWRLQEPPESNKWGHKQQNGSWSGGIMRALVEGKADVGFCCMWVMDPQASDVDFTLPWNTVCVTFLVPRPQRLNQLRAVFLPFASSLWVAIIASIMITTSALWYLQKAFNALSTNTGLSDWVKCFIGVITMTSIPPLRREVYPARYLVTSWAMFTILIATAYSSNLVSHLTVPMYSMKLDSIQDLVRAEIYWSLPYPPAMNKYFDFENPCHRQFMRNFKYDSEPVHVPQSGNPYNYAYFGNMLEGKAPYFFNVTPIQPTEILKLRVMRECTCRYFVSMGLAKNSPYTKSFNEAVVRLIESGILQHWSEDVVSRVPSPIDMKVLTQDGKDNIRPEELRLENLQGAFLLTAVGFLLAITAFTIENTIKLIS